MLTKKKPEDPFVSLSDIMTGLMVIFMFIAISYIVEIQKKQNERDELFTEFKATKENLYKELDSTFNKDFKKWEVELDKDLSIKFTNPEILFESGKYNLKKEFQNILIDFFPKYLKIVTQDKYIDKIAEIRIEGHTDTVSINNSEDSYIGNIKLSQDRSRSVLDFIRQLDCYKNLTIAEKQQMQFWLTANGLSYGRTLDDNKKMTAYTKNRINNKNSRRVEFRIVTTSEKLVEKVINQIDK